MTLTNKVVVVLGGGGLLGSEIARECTQAGARVVVADIKEPEMPAGAVFIPCDATDEAQTNALAQKVQTDFGRIDGVVNATYPSGTKAMQNKGFESGDIDDMLHNMSLHLRTCFLVVRAFAPIFRKQKSGAVVFFGSIYGVAAPRFEMYEGLPMTQPAEYAAAKGGIVAVTRYFASLLGKDGIRVNTISPGGIMAGQPQSFVDAYSKKLLLGTGLLEPKHVSGAAAFLVSDASAMMTGQNLVIDGGWTL
ncbi:MAG: SDR family oxidoreductase [Minisyncoccia bacterium]